MEILKSFLKAGLALAIALPVLIYVVQAKLIYFPRKYDDCGAYLRRAEHLEFQNRGKPQTAFLVARGDEPPRRVWWLFGGNGSLALDWLDLAENVDEPGNVYVLVDYPGYGLCEGRPNPDSIRNSIAALIPKVAQRLNLSEAELIAKSSALGHSLGAAVALDMAANYQIRVVVAISPFTSMKAMASRMVGPVLSQLLTHRYDNVRSLNILATDSGAQVLLFHGTQDEIVPFSMGRQLADDFPATVQFQAVVGAGHNTAIDSIEDALIAILKGGTI